jgi:hypothetical protein
MYFLRAIERESYNFWLVELTDPMNSLEREEERDSSTKFSRQKVSQALKKWTSFET